MAEAQFSDETLNETPEKAVRFLGAIGRTTLVWAMLAENGYSQKEHDLGWGLVHRASNYVPQSPTFTVDAKAAEALAYVDAWEEPNLRRHRSACTRLHPDRVDYLFAGIEFATGAESLVNVTKYLDRVDTLESGKGRERDERSEDARTLATLEQRGLTKAVRKDLREKISTAKGLAGSAPGAVASGAGREEQREALLALKLWFDDWAETARTVIKRRDVLIRLGLAEAKREKAPPQQS